MISAHNKLDLIGQGFGRLVVISDGGRTPTKQVLWDCVCACGGAALATSAHLRSGHTQSCGCLKAEKAAERLRRHGHFDERAQHPLYWTHAHMVSRCLNEKNPAFDRYGGRGISICDRWLSGDGRNTGFGCFVEDMGEKPTPQHSIDRIDNDGNYEPSNCRWATPKEQANNRNPPRWTRWSR